MASSEMVPYAKTGGLADVAGALPFALKYLDADDLLHNVKIDVTDILYNLDCLHNGCIREFNIECACLRIVRRSNTYVFNVVLHFPSFSSDNRDLPRRV